jgi:hypothetical protein
LFSDKVAGWCALEFDPRHHGLRPLVVGARVGDNFVKFQMLKSVQQCSSGAFASEAVAPGAPYESPADLVVRSKWMIAGVTQHDPRIAQKEASSVLDCPAGGAMFPIGCSISVELRIAVGAIDGTALIGHDLAIGVHLRERVAMIFAPRSKSQSGSFNN